MILLKGEGLHLLGGGDPLGPAPGEAAPGEAHNCNPNEPHPCNSNGSATSL
jgi:hypothetical protein